MRCSRKSPWLTAAALAVCLLYLPASFAQTAYRSRDANGQWVFTDRAAGTAVPGGDSIRFARDPESVHIAVERTDGGGSTQLIASSSCLCVVTVTLAIEQSAIAEFRVGATYLTIIQPGAQQTIAVARHAGDADARLQFNWRAALGSPTAVPSPSRLYRAPFSAGASFMVSQAYPLAITHVTPDSRYAIDMALPDGTPVNAAREGTVINLRHDSFHGAAAPTMLDQANFVEILHDDGTIAIYAHLQWDSIRVRIGQHVARGEYIANSGNTGFTTGPHLHFAVWRNVNGADISIPVQFAGLDGGAVTPTTAEALTAY